MVDTLQSAIDSKSLIVKLKNSLDKINTRLSNSNNTSINAALAEANKAFKQFFDTIGDPEFIPEFLLTGDTARSEVYNSNLRAIDNDLTRFYAEIESLNQAQIKAFNFSKVVVSEITARANALASIVLDLNILNGLDRGDVLVAGDDFKNADYIESSQAIASFKAELMSNGSGLGLARNGAQDVLQGAKIEVIPLAPTSDGSYVTITPTAGNLERFYEGCYYNFIGAARPEGGSFNIGLQVVPVTATGTTTSYTSPANSNFINGIVGPSSGPDRALTTVLSDEQTENIYVDYGAPEEAKKQDRKKMIDGDAGTFWECEYVYKAPSSLIPDLQDSIVTNSTNQGENTAADTSEVSVNIDLEQAEKAALVYDTAAKDLVIDIIITLQAVNSINYVTINPIIFGSDSFPEVEDIATASTNDSDFITIDGWDNLRYAKTITPEANEFLTDSQLSATLAPSRNNYMGQGIYPFPVREAKKVKIRMRSRKPVPAPYERTYALLKRQLEEEIVTTTTTKKGALRF